MTVQAELITTAFYTCECLETQKILLRQVHEIHRNVTSGSRAFTGLKISIERAGHILANNSARYSVIFLSSIPIQMRRDACGRDEGCEFSPKFDIS